MQDIPENSLVLSVLDEINHESSNL